MWQLGRQRGAVAMLWLLANVIVLLHAETETETSDSDVSVSAIERSLRFDPTAHVSASFSDKLTDNIAELELVLEEEFYGEDDFFEIYFIKSIAKSMTTEYENSFMVKTSGLLLRNIKTLDMVTLEFLPLNWEQSFFPKIQVLDDSSPGPVTWDKTGKLLVRYEFHPSDYEEALYLGTMNGAVRKTYLSWITTEYIDKPQMFSPQSVCVYKTANLSPVNESCPISLHNWDTFVMHSLEMLSKFDVKLSSVMPVSGDRITIQCSSVSDKMLYHTKLPAYYDSFYSCMREHPMMSYIDAINTCATSSVNKQDGYNFVNVGNMHYIRCGLGKSRKTSGLFATETYYLLSIPAPSEPYSYEADGSIYDIIVAVAILLFLVVGLCMMVGEGYYASKMRIELLQPKGREGRVSSTGDHIDGMMDELDCTEHGEVLSRELGHSKTTSMVVSSGEFRSSNDDKKDLLHKMLRKVQNKGKGMSSGGTKYTSLTTDEDDFDDDDEVKRV